MCTEFGVDSSSRFPFRARTHANTEVHVLTQTVTDATDHLTPRLGFAGMGKLSSTDVFL